MNKDTQSWSNSNLTEMEELLQKVQQLQRENAALRSLIDDPNAMHSHYLRECNGWEVWQAERIRRFQDASEQLEQLERENAALRNELAKLQEWTNQIRDDLEEACSERDANWEKVGNLVDLLIESLKYLDNHNVEAEGGAELVHKIKMAVIQDRGLWE